MNVTAPSRPPLKIRRINLDTGRENVVVISRRCKALRAEVFRGFSRVELRGGNKVILATLLLTDDGIVAPDELGLAESAFRRFGEPPGSLVSVTPAAPPESLDAVRAKIQGRTLSTAEINAIIGDISRRCFEKHARQLDSDIAIERLLGSQHLRCTESVEQSKAIAMLTGFHIIVAASGMCDAGRIRHHLKRWLWHNKATVLLVGFQARGTLGRFLIDGVKAVRIQGDEVKVAARIRRLDGYSGHADGPELARWIASRRPIQRGVFLVHGEELALRGLSARIAERTVPAANIFMPLLDDIYELTTSAPTPIDVSHRRRLAPEAVVNLDWHNDMSTLILDLNDRMQAAADDRARGVILRRLRRALDGEDR